MNLDYKQLLEKLEDIFIEHKHTGIEEKQKVFDDIIKPVFKEHYDFGYEAGYSAGYEECYHENV